MQTVAMSKWHVSWREVENEWTTEQFNLFMWLWAQEQAMVSRAYDSPGSAPRSTAGRGVGDKHTSSMNITCMADFDKYFNLPGGRTRTATYDADGKIDYGN